MHTTLRFCPGCSLASPLAVPHGGQPGKLLWVKPVFLSYKIIFMLSCLHLPAWLPKKTETCTKCHQPGFVQKLTSWRPLSLELACISSCPL